jgi:hypothetical protein
MRIVLRMRDIVRKLPHCAQAKLGPPNGQTHRRNYPRSVKPTGSSFEWDLIRRVRAQHGHVVDGVFYIHQFDVMDRIPELILLLTPQVERMED